MLHTCFGRGKISYTTIKNSITAFTNLHSDKAVKPKSREQIESRNRGGYAVDSDIFSLEVLLEKSRKLAGSEDEGGQYADFYASIERRMQFLEIISKQLH